MDDIDAAVDELIAKGIARGKASNQGPDIAWFTDNTGNILSVLSN